MHGQTYATGLVHSITPMDCLVQRLEQAGTLSPEDKQAVMNLGNGRITCTDAKTCVSVPRGAPEARLIVRGVACRYATLPDGRRQISAWLFPGDMCDLEACLLNRAPESVIALTELELLTLPRFELRELMARFPGVSIALWRLTVIEQSIARQWMMNLGRRSALEATAHLLCEIFIRLQAAGLADGDACDLPMTQRDLADSLALTPVHMNRMLMGLRRVASVMYP
jgi:CRP-like cAMP-binding protein